MKRIYCMKSFKYSKVKNSKMSYILNKILVLSIICGNNNEKIFKEESIDILKIIGLINNKTT